MAELILEGNPSTLKSKVVTNLVLLAILTIPFYFILHNILYVILAEFICMGMIYFIINTDKMYDGWLINETGIKLLKNNFSGLQSCDIPFTQITEITYFAGAKNTPPQITLITNTGKKGLIVRIDIFIWAYTLKYFQSKGIKITLHSSDDEVQLFLDSKVENIPITNAY